MIPPGSIPLFYTLVAMNKNALSVENVSDSNIEITAADNGSNGLLLTFKNPSKNIIENTDFTYQLKFSQEQLSNSVFLIEEATFVPSTIILTTNSITSITATSALCTANIIYQETSPIRERGVCWGTGPKPTILDSKTSDGQGVGTFTSNLQGLLSGTKYYVRAYAGTNEEIFYGNEVSFITAFSSQFVIGEYSLDVFSYPMQISFEPNGNGTLGVREGNYSGSGSLTQTSLDFNSTFDYSQGEGFGIEQRTYNFSGQFDGGRNVGDYSLHIVRQYYPFLSDYKGTFYASLIGK